jgi:leucyl aminopeptidase
MIDIKRQATLDLTQETKDLVLFEQVDHPLFQELDKALNGALKTDIEQGVETIRTLGAIAAKRIHLVGAKQWRKEDEQEGILERIAKLGYDVVYLLDTFDEDERASVALRLAEAVHTANYTFQRFKTKLEQNTPDIHRFYHCERDVQEQVVKGLVYGEMKNKCKDLVNTPYNHLNAIDLANYAKELERYDHITVTIHDKAEIEAMNMGAFLGVNKGSKDEPRLIKVHYNKTNGEPVALVGKGVMYDTGGYSLKTTTGMPGMKVDMAGAAAVLSAIEAIAKLDLDANVMAIVAATDNRIGDDAIVPDDILVSASGQTIEIVSTDAEGRLTLADALWYAQEQGATSIIDTATLTGSIVRALGGEFTGAFTNDEAFYAEFDAATKRANEPLWRMPIAKGYHDKLKSKVADMKNSGGAQAGASVAAAFLEKYINPGTRWIHLDIAGTASDEKYWASGVMVKSFTELFCK